MGVLGPRSPRGRRRRAGAACVGPIAQFIWAAGQGRRRVGEWNDLRLSRRGDRAGDVRERADRLRPAGSSAGRLRRGVQGHDQFGRRARRDASCAGARPPDLDRPLDSSPRSRRSFSRSAGRSSCSISPSPLMVPRRLRTTGDPRDPQAGASAVLDRGSKKTSGRRPRRASEGGAADGGVFASLHPTNDDQRQNFSRRPKTISARSSTPS